MAKFVLKDANVRFNEIDITGILNSINMQHEIETRDADTFDISSKRRLAGLENTSINHNGFWDAANVEDLEFFTMLTGGPLIYSVAPEGNTEGNVAFVLQAFESQYSPGGTIGDVFSFTLNLESTSPLVRGKLGATGAKIATGNGASQSLGAVTAAQKIYGALHVIAASGTNPTLDVTVESDDNAGFSSPTTRLTFTQVTTTPTSQFLSADGAITDTFWRVKWTIADDSAGSPSYTIFVVIGIR